MKVWKVIILVCGLAGLAGFFLPMATTTDAAGKSTSYSALDIMRGGGNAGQVVGTMKDVGEGHAVSKELTEKIDAHLSQGVMALKGIVAALFLPALLLVVLGLSGIVRGRFGRVGAIGAIVFGLVSAAVWGIFYLGASSGAATLGLGLHMLLVAGLGGIIGGIGNFVKPDGDRWTGV
jgi:hypothetical protein